MFLKHWCCNLTCISPQPFINGEITWSTDLLTICCCLSTEVSFSSFTSLLSHPCIPTCCTYHCICSKAGHILCWANSVLLQSRKVGNFPHNLWVTSVRDPIIRMKPVPRKFKIIFLLLSLEFKYKQIGMGSSYFIFFFFNMTG